MHVRLSKSIQGFASIKSLKYEVFKVKFRNIGLEHILKEAKSKYESQAHKLLFGSMPLILDAIVNVSCVFCYYDGSVNKLGAKNFRTARKVQS